MKKIYAALFVAMAVCLSACSGKSNSLTKEEVSVTPVEEAMQEVTSVSYTSTYLANEYPDSTYQMKYVKNQELDTVCTVTLNDDGTYLVKKQISNENADAMNISVFYTFTGTYTRDGDTVVLEAAKYAEKSENWGTLSSEISAAAGTSDDDVNLLNYFPTSYLDSNTYNNPQRITLKDDGTCNFTMPYEYKKIPVQYRDKKCPEQGTFEKIEYTTRLYSLDTPVTETMYVYLPYAYDDSKQYNILYLLHGGGDNETFWFYGNGSSNANPITKEVVDNLIYKGKCEPLIIVTPTINTNDFTGFWEELRNDIIPTIESKYTTYANGDTSLESIIASRDHRAMAGLSMGSMTTFHSGFLHCIDEISWFGNFSGAKIEKETFLGALTSNEFKDYKINYWYNGNGTKDIAHDEHLAFYNEILDSDTGIFVEGDNCIFIDKPDKIHSYDNWIIDLYNILTVSFFK